ncbi:MAG: hypothetical protein JWP97_6157 [Labilithrix sp.]|nr:hypothetical protein [Labilithrix sp.]
MKLRRSALATLLLGSCLIASAVIACGSDDGNSAGPGGSSGGDGDGALADGGGDGEEGPIVRKEFPLATPSLGGYTLVDAFPGVVFDIPSAIAWPKLGGAPFVLERTGQIRRIEGSARRDVLDFSSQVHVAGEGGALGLVLHPKFGDGSGAHDFAYVWYNACGDATCATPYSQRLQRYTWNGTVFEPSSVLTMIEEREYVNVHNSGKMLFGPDGFLYFGNGDDDTVDNHQTITNALFAGIFRIDVDQDPAKSHAIPPGHTTLHDGPFTRTGYMIPNDNPFVGLVPNGLEEFYALGFRNPFGWSFDKVTGDLWMGDVGDSFREEVNKVVKGGNYQWPLKEGELASVTTKLTSYVAGTPTPPAFYYSHAEMADLVSVFGGTIYRGKALPELDGKYLFSDWPSNRVWALDITKSPATRTTLLDNQYRLQPMGIAEDNEGEFYILQYGPDLTNDPASFGGHVKKLARDTSRDALPKRLRETFLFDDVPSLTPAANLVPYEVTSPLWSDGAVKKRWIRLPEGKKVTTKADGSLAFPVGTVFVKQFDLPDAVKPKARTRRLETRVMVVGTETTYGYTFRWNAAGTDADLVSEGTDETITDESTGQTRNWHYPSFGQCWSCHRDDARQGAEYQKDRWRILGFTGPQLSEAQRTFLTGKGVIDAAEVAKLPPVIASPTDATKTAEERAYAYLAANCSPCHHEGASYTGGGDTWVATVGGGNLAARHLDQAANNYPMTVRLGIPNGKLVAPGDPGKSVLLARIKSNDPDLRMPPIARNVVDDQGAAILEAWIAGMAP